MGNYINLDIEIQSIKDFLTKILETVDAEIKIIIEQEEAGRFFVIDDFPNALFIPLEREAIALRAVFHELNALIEWELQDVALDAHLKSDIRAPKTFDDISSLDEISRVKLVYDLNFSKICNLIEVYYEIDLSKLTGYEQFQIIRQSVNAFKHRKGFKDLRKDKGAKLLDQYKLNRKDVYQAIEVSKAFIRALRRAIGR